MEIQILQYINTASNTAVLVQNLLRKKQVSSGFKGVTISPLLTAKNCLPKHEKIL